MYKISNNWLEMLKEKEFKKDNQIQEAVLMESSIENMAEESDITIQEDFAAHPLNLQIFPAL